MKSILALIPLAGCAVGAGSAYVGQWRPHDEVAFEACLVDDQGKCLERKEVVEHVPGRRFWGVLIAFPAVGAAGVTHAGDSQTVFRVEPSLEILRGSGRWAVGIRGGPVIDSGVGMDAKGGAVSVPLTAIGRLSVLDQVSVYAGLGFSPFARLAGETAFSAERALAGLQLALSKTHSENFIILSVEVDQVRIQFDDPYRSTGVTGNIGLFF